MANDNIKKASINGEEYDIVTDASKIAYNDSNVESALDDLTNTTDKLKRYPLLGEAKTPTTVDAVVDISLSESMFNYMFLVIEYGFGWGWNSIVTIPTNFFPITQIVGCTEVYAEGYPRVARAEVNNANSVRIKAHSLLGATQAGADDRIRIYGLIKKS